MASSYPTVEIVKFSVNDAFKHNPIVINEFLDLLVQAPGVSGAWHGPELQDESIHYVVVKWDFKEASHDYSPVKAALFKASKEVIHVHYVHFEGSVENALNAPITELAVADVKETSDMDLFHERRKALLTKMLSELAHEVRPGAMGVVDGKPRKFYVCLGWQSLERFYKEIQSRPDVVDVVMKVRELVDFDLKHAQLTKYKKL